MKGRTIKRIILLLVVFFLPFSFLYFFSLGKHSFGTLPYYGKEGPNGRPFSFPDFQFYDAQGKELTQKDFAGKILLVFPLESTCPHRCDIAVLPFRLVVYKELLANKKFNDVLVLTELLDTLQGGPALMAEKLDVDPSRWIFYTTPHNPFWDVEMNGHLLTEPDKDNPDRPFFRRSIMLIDTLFSPRGFYDGSQAGDMRRIMEEVRLLKKEYDVNKKK